VTAAYPFSAVVGMPDLKLALIVNAVSPVVGGVLLRGEKGTAKSTVVRALAGLLPDVAVIEGCRFGCDPHAPDPQCPDGPHQPGGPAYSRPARLVELPVGASEDRVVGSLDLERALTEGVRAYQPGLLAAAHRGVLYVDEVNLLPDHLVDLLLDAAALGTSYVEREGVSIRHAARFLLVGTMNPEEGELRPQLLDRFGLTVEVAASRDPAERAEVVRRRLAYEADPDGFAAAWRAEDAALAERIAAARTRLPAVVLGDPALRQVTSVCAAFEVDGLRADLVTARAAIALAAWAGRDAVTAEDVRQAALLALPHRRRRNPFDAPGLDEQQLDDVLTDADADAAGDGPEPEPPPRGGGGQPVAGEPAGEPNGPGSLDPPTDGSEPAPAAGPMPPPPEQAPVPAGTPYRVRTLTAPSVGPDAPAGRRGRSSGDTGRTIRARRPAGRLRALHLSGTVQAAAPYQRERGRSGPGLRLQVDDLREAVRSGREGNLVLFVVDASGSMAARQRMRAVKEAALSLLVDAYQRRDKVGMVTFRGSGAQVALPPTSSVEVGAARLAALPTGGRTPLAAGLVCAAEVLRVERLRDPRRRPLVVLLTDGRATAGSNAVGDALRAAAHLGRARAASIVIDCESGPVRLGLAPRLAVALGGDCLQLGELAAGAINGLVRASGPRRVA
jgi:magnesium chelatase subunit D